MYALNRLRTLIMAIAVIVLALPGIVFAAGNSTIIQLVGNVTTVPQQLQLNVVSSSASSGCCGFGPGLAIDGSFSTRWGSAIGVDPAWITLDLGSAQDLTSVTIYWEAANAENYEIRGSNDNSNWTTLATETGGLFGDRTDTVAVAGNYRYVQMYGISRSVGNEWGYSIWEMEVYGTGKGSDTDNDGVIDSADQCPGTPANTAVGSDGCDLTSFGGYDAPTSYPGLTLSWSDEFNGTTLSSDWVYDIGTGSNGWGNNELQYYRSQNTSVGNGYLTIEAREESFGGQNYTSSRIKTEGQQAFQYGRIDIRAVLPEGQGLWPALWMLGDNFSSVGWPFSGEIDIMELRGNEPDRVSAAAHWYSGGHVFYTSDCANPGCTNNSPVLSSGTFADEFHVFSIVWDASKIEWYLDDASTPFHVIDITPSALSELRAPFFFIMNVAVGGNFLPNPNGTASFPQQMIVDYVRVYQ